MTEVAQLAQDAMNVLTPLLPAATAGSKALDSLASESGKTLMTWLTSRFKDKPAATTLDRAVAEPENPRRLDSLRLEIEDLAASDPAFRQQLTDLLRSIAPAAEPGHTQTASPAGSGNTITQVIGSHNTTR